MAHHDKAEGQTDRLRDTTRRVPNVVARDAPPISGRSNPVSAFGYVVIVGKILSLLACLARVLGRHDVLRVLQDLRGFASCTITIPFAVESAPYLIAFVPSS
jgi:hypothetical protein